LKLAVLSSYGSIVIRGSLRKISSLKGWLSIILLLELMKDLRKSCMWKGSGQIVDS